MENEYIGKMQRVLTKNGNEYVGYFQEDDSFMTTFGWSLPYEDIKRVLDY